VQEGGNTTARLPPQTLGNASPKQKPGRSRAFTASVPGLKVRANADGPPGT
jgi:hypothetical protein